MKKTEVGHSKIERVERAKGRTRGQFLSLLVDQEVRDGSLFMVVADENEALVSDADVRAWMEENEFVGTLHPVRFARGKGDTTRRSFTRAKREVFAITSE